MNFAEIRGFILFIAFQLALLWCIPLHAQFPDFYFKNIYKEDGLPANTVRGIVKDKLGFLWIATNSGLCRYDKQGRMKVFREDRDNNKLHSNMAEFLYTDSKGFLWVATRGGGLTKIDVETDTWITYRHDPDNPNSLAHDELLCVMEDTQGRIWIGTEDGVSILYPEEERFVNFRVNKEDDTALQGKSVLSFLQDKNGLIWVGTWGGGLHLFLPNQDNIEESMFRNFMTKGKIAHNIIWEICQDKSGRYWLGEEWGLVYMQVDERASDKVSEQNWEVAFHDYPQEIFAGRQIFSMLNDWRGNLWVSSLNGLKLIERASLPDTSRFLRITKEKPDLQFQHFYPDGNNIFSIPSDNIYYLYEDNQQLIWICTPKGLGQFSWRSRQFGFIQPEGIEDKRNSVAFAEGILFFRPEKNEGIVYNTNNNTTKKFRLPENSVLRSSSFSKMVYNNDGTLSILTKDGIAIYDMKKDTCLHEFIFKDHKIIFQNRMQYTFYSDKIWMGEDRGLYVFDTQSKQFKHYFHDKNDEYSLVNNAISCFEVDVDGNLWVGTWKGISIVDKAQLVQSSLPDKFRFRNYSVALVPENFISDKVVTLTNSSDRMYIGTFDGIMSFEYESEQFTDRTNDEYRFAITSINNRSENSIWMTTEEGIVNYNLDKNTYKIYAKEYGIDDVFLRDGKTHTDNEGKIYFTGKDAILQLDPDELIENDKPPEVFITEAQVLNSDGAQYTDLIGTNKFELEYHDYYIALSFSALNYDSPEKNCYKYRLEGFDENWTATKSTEPIVYTNLDAGNYTFRVKAANNDGVWNEEGASLEITKKPALWETNFFRVGLILLTILAIFWGVRSYNRRLVRRYKKMASYNKKLNTEITERKKAEKSLQQKNDELVSINHDLEQFAYICSHDLKEPIRGAYSFSNLIERKIKDETTKKETAPYFKFVYNYLQTLQNIIAALGTFTEVNKKQTFTPVPIRVDGIFEKIEFGLNKLVQDKNAVLHFNNSTDSDKIYGSEYELVLVLQNLVQNGIKYNQSQIPEVFINLTDDKEGWLFSVTDNGVGIEEEYHEYVFKPFKTLRNKNRDNSSGLGLTICAKIVAQLGGKIWLKSTLNEGSTFYVFLAKQTSNEESKEEIPKLRIYSVNSSKP